LLLVREEKKIELAARVAARATDDDAVVRSHVVETLRVLEAGDAASLGALELLAKDQAPAVAAAAGWAIRSVKFRALVRAVRDPELAAIVARLEREATRSESLAELRARGAAAADARAALLFLLAERSNREAVQTLLAIAAIDAEIEEALKRQASWGVREAELALAQMSPKQEPEPAPVRHEPPPQPKLSPLVAVFTLDAKMLKAGDRATLTDVFAALLTSVGGFRVVPRDAIKERLTQSKLASYRACVDESCQIELGKALAAEKVINTKVVRQGTTCLTTATLYDLRTEASERASVAKSACSSAALTQALTTLAGDLAPR
jgi:hypothetical protein